MSKTIEFTVFAHAKVSVPIKGKVVVEVDDDTTEEMVRENIEEYCDDISIDLSSYYDLENNEDNSLYPTTQLRHLTDDQLRHLTDDEISFEEAAIDDYNEKLTPKEEEEEEK